MKVIILRFWQLKVLVFSSNKQLRAAFMAVTVVTVLFTSPLLSTIISGTWGMGMSHATGRPFFH